MLALSIIPCATDYLRLVQLVGGTDLMPAGNGFTAFPATSSCTSPAPMATILRLGTTAIRGPHIAANRASMIRATPSAWPPVPRRSPNASPGPSSAPASPGWIRPSALRLINLAAEWTIRPPTHRRNSPFRRDSRNRQPTSRSTDMTLPATRPIGSSDSGSTATSAATYEIRIAGHLDDYWSATLAELTLVRLNDGTTSLTGPLVDQAQLHGVLARIRDLGVPLLTLSTLDCAGTSGEPHATTTTAAIPREEEHAHVNRHPSDSPSPRPTSC
jgi:hypothetical protein